jgi:SAM-dependent methyltransferase
MSRRDDRTDAFGRALIDHLARIEDACHVVERDDGFVEAGPMDYYFAQHRDWPDCEKTSIRQARGRVLDIGCGAGRCALFLQEKGLAVTGVDVSPLAIRVCRLRGLRRARVAAIEGLDAFRPRSFDTALLFGGNFGLFRSARKLPGLLRHLHRALSDDGVILASTLDPYKTPHAAHRAYHDRNRRRGRMAGQIRMRIRYREYATPWFDYLFVSRRELRALLRGTGWAVDRVTASTGAAYAMMLRKA